MRQWTGAPRTLSDSTKARREKRLQFNGRRETFKLHSIYGWKMESISHTRQPKCDKLCMWTSIAIYTWHVDFSNFICVRDFRFSFFLCFFFWIKADLCFSTFTSCGLDISFNRFNEHSYWRKFFDTIWIISNKNCRYTHDRLPIGGRERERIIGMEPKTKHKQNDNNNNDDDKNFGMNGAR